MHSVLRPFVELIAVVIKPGAVIVIRDLQEAIQI